MTAMFTFGRTLVYKNKTIISVSSEENSRSTVTLFMALHDDDRVQCISII